MSSHINAISWRTFFLNHRMQAFKTSLISLLIIIVSLVAIKLTYKSLAFRDGILLNDFILDLLPSYDLSWPIFLILYALLICALLRFIAKPIWLLFALRLVAILNILRMLSIVLVPLEPPPDLVPMYDPLASFAIQINLQAIQHDLFFSGHLSNLLAVLMVHKLYENGWSALSISHLVGTLVIALMLLIQHIHYTVDLLGAVPAVFISYYIVSHIDKCCALYSPNRHD